MKTYYYSLLRYHPSYVLGECINVGIFYWFEEERKAYFDYPTALHYRVKHFYPDANIEWLQWYLEKFKGIAKGIAKDNLFVPETAQGVINHYFGVKDATSLVFDAPLVGLYNDKEKLLAQGRQTYFSVYHSKNEEEEKYNDDYLIDAFKKLVQKTSAQRFLRNKYVVQYKKSAIEFEYAWQNGHINLVQPLSFDYKKGQSIRNKADHWVGRLVQIESLLEPSKMQIDFMVAPPQNKELMPLYHDAIDIIKENTNTECLQFIKESELSQYVQQMEGQIREMKA